MLSYQAQDCSATLGQGLAEYARAHPFLKRGESLSVEAREFFRCHDVVHVVYGCDTSLPQEAVVKLSSFFGTTGGFGVMQGYRLYESQDIYRQLRLGDVAWTIVAAFVIVPRTLWRCARQTRRWPWDAHDAWLNVPLAEIRATFAIRVAR